jgi:hypothetical protein
MQQTSSKQGGITHPVKLKSEVRMVRRIAKKENDSKVKQGNQKDRNPTKFE